ncbi:hypothetical protein [Marinitoga aeolica]|uniref:DUF4129 domain-containing protein n=1 Tax=Marinitoga aeolica TaxID=2809031 RepID=A0ABY8PNC2_9BACT|nr:hypothetical protein [Marinitoga aeolica]WGS64142.1 hypothetical protein JRV97_07095 [Marinitoga aeolica]
MKKQRELYLLSLFLTFVPFNLHSGIVIFLLGILFSFLFIRIRKFGMPYYIAFLSLIGIYALVFFLLNATGSKNLFYSFNLIAIVVLSYFLPLNSRDIIKFTFIFLISIILLRGLINPIFPLIAFIISLIELFKDQKNKKLIITIFSIFIIFSVWNFNTYYNPFKEFHLSSDTQLLNEKKIENKKVTNQNKTLEKIPKEIEKNKSKFIGNITVKEKKMIKKNNNIVDTIVLINIIIGGIIGIITAVITWRLLTKKEKKKIIISLVVFFSAWALMATGVAYMNRGRPPMVDKGTISINDNISNKSIDALSSDKILETFREIANSPRTAYIKLYQEIKWIFFIVSSLFGVTVIIFIRKFFANQEKDKEEVEKFSIEKFEHEDIPYLIEEGYKYIRKRFFKIFSHLTPYELLKEIDYPKEFELLTNLFVLKEYGEKDYKHTKEEIKAIINKCIEFFKNN